MACRVVHLGDAVSLWSQSDAMAGAQEYTQLALVQMREKMAQAKEARMLATKAGVEETKGPSTAEGACCCLRLTLWPWPALLTQHRHWQSSRASDHQRKLARCFCGFVGLGASPFSQPFVSSRNQP